MKAKFLKHQRLCLAFFFLLLSFLMLAPYFPFDVIVGLNGQDVSFHLARIDEIYHALLQGNFYPTVSSYTFTKNTAGYAVNLFYPDLTLLPFVFLRFITQNPIVSYWLGWAFWNFVGLEIAYHFMKKFSGQFKQALLFAILYSFSTYRLIDIFSRGDVAEAIAMTLLPMAFYGLWQLSKGYFHDWYWATSGLSLIAFTHVLTFFMTMIFAVILFVIALLKNKAQRLKVAFIGFGTTLAVSILSAEYFLPLLEQESYQLFNQPRTHVIVQDALNPLTLLQRIFVNAWLPNPGIFLFFVSIVLFIFLVIIKKLRNRFYIGTFISGIVILIITTNLFPWEFFQNTPLREIQFPYRFMQFATLFLCIFMSWAMCQLKVNKRILMGSMAVFFVVQLGTITMAKIIQSSGYKLITTSNYENTVSEKINYDYVSQENLVTTTTPGFMTMNIDMKDDTTILANRKPSPYLPASDFTHKGYIWTIHHVNGKYEVLIPLIAYKGWQVTDQSGYVFPVKVSPMGSLEVDTLPTTKTLTIVYQHTPVQILAILMSTISWGILFFYALLRQKSFLRNFQKILRKKR